MDILRTSIQILFSETDISSLLEGRQAREDMSFNKTLFSRLYQCHCPSETLDQALLKADYVGSYYMKPIKDDVGRFSYSVSSILNMPIHFSREALYENGGEVGCCFHELLRWHELCSTVGEDLIVSSFLASRDVARNRRRNTFNWKLVLGQDDALLNSLFRKPMADVHLHLEGSSGNFDLNWLSLMTRVGNRRVDFSKLNIRQKPIPLYDNSLADDSLYALTVKACAIRLRLFLKYIHKHGSEDYNLIDSVIYSKLENTSWLAFRLEGVLRKYRLMNNGEGFIDYIYSFDKELFRNNPSSILIGERMLLYNCFFSCYEGTISKEDERLFYAYLLIKNRIRSELIQSNSIIGFKNFDAYETRKNLFIRGISDYETLVEPFALGMYFCEGRPRYVEPRITPKDSAKKLNDIISDTDRRICEYSKAGKNQYHYVLHFIKSRDLRCVNNYTLLVFPRHYDLRKRIRRCSFALDRFRRVSKNYERVVGIDAANSEILTRPEVFSQAFRYLRNTTHERNDGVSPSRLGMTYHVGEDFLTVLDGLRSVDEVIHYMDIRRNDRLGHALVLGIDVREYFLSRHMTLLLPKEVLLDDIAWALSESDDSWYTDNLKHELETLFYTYVRDVYRGITPTLRDYYDSWLLRGDNPERYRYIHSLGISSIYNIQLPEWSKYDLNTDEKAMTARKNSVAVEMFYRYHYDKNVRIAGNEIVSVKFKVSIINLIEHLQEKIRKKVYGLGISIESNPTSNVRIGGFRKYINHPILTFYPIDRENDCRIPTSINTDDRGVFATSIEREYALLSCALDKVKNKKVSHEDGVDWLDRIRQNGLNQRFIDNQ